MLWIERTRWRTGWSLVYRGALLSMLLSAGCAEPGSVGSAISRWWKSAGGELNTSSTSKSVPSPRPSDRAANVPVYGEGMESSGEVNPQRAAEEALEASRKAQAAAMAAVQASKEAIEASKMAVKAATQTSDERIPPRATVAAPEPPQPESTVPTSETPLKLSATGETAVSKSREETADLLRRLDRSFHGIDSTKLPPDDANRRDLAGKLLKSAQKAFNQGDYAEANGLAGKASVMLAPLVGIAPEPNTKP